MCMYSIYTIFWGSGHKAASFAISKLEPTMIALEQQREPAVLIASFAITTEELVLIPPISVLAQARQMLLL